MLLPKKEHLMLSTLFLVLVYKLIELQKKIMLKPIQLLLASEVIIMI